MKRWKWCLAALAVLSLIGLQGVVSPSWGAEPIKIGLPLPLTGTQAKFGDAIRNAYMMALEEINAQGGIRKGPLKGRTIEFLLEDTQSKPDVAKASAEKLITRDKVPMIVGEYSSANTYAVAGTINSYEIPYLIQTGAADNITQQGWKWVFRINAPSNEFAAGLQDFLAQVVKPKSMGIIFENTLFGTSMSKAMREWADRQKVEITNFEPYEAGGIDFKPTLLKVKAKNPDIVYMVSYLLDALQLVKQSREVGLSPKLFTGGAAGFTLPEFVQGAGPLAENLVTATQWAADVKYPGSKEFDEKYYQKYKVRPEYHSTEGYAAALVLRDVLERTASLKNEDLRKALSETNLMTPFGPVKFTAYEKYTNQNRNPTPALQIQKGKLVTIWPKEFAAAPYVYPVKKP